MKRFLSVAMACICLMCVSPCFSLTLEDVLGDIQDLPKVKLITPSDKTSAEQIKAVQIFVLPSSRTELESLLKKWSESGINAVIVRVFHNSDDRYHQYLKTAAKEGVYFKTTRAPVIRDVLQEIIPLAKNYGLKVFPWMTTRYANYGTPGLPRMIAYSFSQKKLVTSKGLDIFSEAAQDHILGLFSDLAAYPIDGILLQDDLFLKHNEGFTESAVRQFKEDTGFAPIPANFFKNGSDKITYTDDFWTWRRWKSGKIAGLVSKINKAIKIKNQDVKLIVNLTYEAVSHPKGALAWLAHDIEQLKPVSDYFSLMAYHRQIMEELKIDFDTACNYMSDMIKRCQEIFPEEPQRFLFKIQVKDWTTNQPIDEDEIRTLLRRTAGMESLSIAVVPYPPDISASLMKEIFNKKTSISLGRP
jgi:hypothetical protein